MDCFFFFWGGGFVLLLLLFWVFFTKKTETVILFVHNLLSSPLWHHIFWQSCRLTNVNNKTKTSKVYKSIKDYTILLNLYWIVIRASSAFTEGTWMSEFLLISLVWCGRCFCIWYLEMRRTITRKLEFFYLVRLVGCVFVCVYVGVNAFMCAGVCVYLFAGVGVCIYVEWI